MSMEEALRARLVGDIDVSAIVGTRVYWGIRPQDRPLPAIVLTIVSDPRPQHLTDFNSLRATRVQIDCDARTSHEARQLRDAAIGAVVPKATNGTTRFDRSRINNVMDRGEDTAAGYVHRQLIDATIWHGQME